MSQLDLESFKTKISITIDSENYLVKTASTPEDLKLALKLRHQVFFEEGLNKTHETGLEFDSYDQIADHLLIIDKNNGQIAGTYRLIHSDFADSFYSENEFVLDQFLKIDGRKLEMGRACTHIDYRTGHTMDLLWQGLSRYITESKTRFLFGCSSVQSIDPEFIFSITKSLNEKDNLSFEYDIVPTQKYSYTGQDKHFAEAKTNPKVIRSLPPLLRSYLHAGSKVHGMPAIDIDFKCTDMLTILDLRLLNKKFAERYNPQAG